MKNPGRVTMRERFTRIEFVVVVFVALVAAAAIASALRGLLGRSDSGESSPARAVAPAEEGGP